MQRILTSFALTLALALGAGRAAALGFGKVSGNTVLGHPLSLVVALRLEEGEAVEASCIRADVSMGERRLPSSLVRVRLETAAGSGERRIRVATTVPVDEPVLNIDLHAGCGGASLSRNLLVFADPPLRVPVVGESAEEASVPDRAPSPLAMLPGAMPQAPAASSAASAIVEKGRRARRPASGAPEAASPKAARDADPRTSSNEAARVRAKPAAAPRVSRGPVLRLDPVEADALILPSLQMDTRLAALPGGAAGSSPRFIDPEQEQRLREQERLKGMEAALLKLRSDSQATQKALADMQLRVRAAESSRYANPLVYALAALCVLMAGGLGFMLWLRYRERQAAWWASPLEAESGSGPVPQELPAEVPMPKEPPAAPPPAAKATARVQPPPAFSLEPPPAPVPAARPPEAAGVVDRRRPMSAEELIDLEQQADFFVVLGQDDAAIDLLMGHVRNTGGVSPLPYIKLLEIYRRRGEREPYDRIRERFNRRFNAFAPEWEVGPEQGLTLEDYPEVLGRLQKSWATPSMAMELIDAALFRRDAAPTFDVPAYRELLFLYGITRDLSERDVGPDGVDLLLPLIDESAPVMTSVAATPPPASPPQSGFILLDLDVSTEQPPSLSLEDPDFKRRLR